MFSFENETFDFAHKLDKPNAPTEEYYKHIHFFNEILYLVHGDIDFTVEAETRHLKEGDLVFIPSGKYHFATVNSKVLYERYVLKFPDKYVPDYVKQKLSEGSFFFFNSKKYSMVFNMFDGYVQEYNRDELHVVFAAELIKLMTMLCHEPLQNVEKHEDFISQLTNYIENNLHKNLTLRTLTEEFHYSRSFICTEFKQRMHIPLMKYIRTKKIIAAHQMIINGVKKTEAAEYFGFDTYSTFYRAYKSMLQSCAEKDD